MGVVLVHHVRPSGWRKRSLCVPLMADTEKSKVDHLQAAYGLSYHCSRSIVLDLKSRGLLEDPILWDAVEASIASLHRGSHPVLKATDYAAAWAYCLGFAIRDRTRIFKL